MFINLKLRIQNPLIELYVAEIILWEAGASDEKVGSKSSAQSSNPLQLSGVVFAVYRMICNEGGRAQHAHLLHRKLYILHRRIYQSFSGRLTSHSG